MEIRGAVRAAVEGSFSASSEQSLIDHPQDPANRTLAHSCVEAPEMLNVYSGVVALDANGRATVRMPRYFGALNGDARYQLTAINAAAPDLHVATEIAASSFVIAGGVPGQERWWIVTGVWHDACAAKHPLLVDRPKRRTDRIKYLNPELFDRPGTEGIRARWYSSRRHGRQRVSNVECRPDRQFQGVRHRDVHFDHHDTGKRA
jgi:hypothetical protein